MDVFSNAPMPFHTFLWKICSRCNLDCTYCYVYNSVDQRWRRQPKVMSEDTARQIARRMLEHLRAHGKDDASLIFHGGEPLMGGLEHVRMLLRVIQEELRDAGIGLSLGMQSNGLLFTPEIGDLLLEHKVSIGVSMDGPPEVNDRYRVNHKGRPSSRELEARLRVLTRDPYRKNFAGFLCVIDPEVDPIAVQEYLLGYQPGFIDYLLPLDNHDRRPRGKVEDPDATPYGDWLIACFDHWWTAGKPTQIRFFDSILQLICGLPTFVESLGLDPVDLVVVETNGEIEGVDSLKTTYDGATALGFDVHQHSFDEVARHRAVRHRQAGAQQLCGKCRECPVVDVCGGGYIPHRYSEARGFDNPSVYCTDLEKLIRHIHRTFFTQLQRSPLSAEVRPAEVRPAEVPTREAVA